MVLTLDMRQFFPREIDALFAYNGSLVEQKYGDYDQSRFSNDRPKQLIVCRCEDSTIMRPPSKL